MRLLEATSVGVEYGQIYVMGGTTTWSDPIGTIGGQRNGLCGPRWPGALVLITGLHTGQVLFTVDVDDRPGRPGVRCPAPRKVSVPTSPRLGAANPLIGAALPEDLTACCRQRLTARRVLGRLVDEHGMAGLAYSSVRVRVDRWLPPVAVRDRQGPCRSGFVHRCRVLVVARRDYYPGGSSCPVSSRRGVVRCRSLLS